MSNISTIIKTVLSCVLILSLSINYGFIKGIITLPTQEIAQKNESEGWNAIYAEAEKYNKKGK